MSQKTVYLNPRFAVHAAFLERLPLVMEQEGRVVQDGRNLIKVFALPDGTLLNVKRYHQPHGLNALVYSLGVRKPKGARAYLYARRLLAEGFETPEPVAYIEERGRGLLGYTYFVSVQCAYEHKMYEWGDAPAGTYEAFAQAFGRYSARLHDAGILHRDYTPGNVLWQPDGGGYRFSLVDINQMGFGRVSRAKGCRNICKFWGPKRFMQLVARAYGEARGMDADQCEQLVMAHRRRFWQRYMRRKPGKAAFHVEL